MSVCRRFGAWNKALEAAGLGFWAALREEFPETVEQRCWVHKTTKILDKMPKSVQQRAKAHILDMYMASTKEEVIKAYKHFLSQCQAKYERACNCLEKDKDILFAFYGFPAEHRRHIRSTNPIESTFASVRLRTNRIKRLRLKIGNVDHGFQAGNGSGKNLAENQETSTHRQGH